MGNSPPQVLRGAETPTGGERGGCQRLTQRCSPSVPCAGLSRSRPLWTPEPAKSKTQTRTSPGTHVSQGPRKYLSSLLSSHPLFLAQSRRRGPRPSHDLTRSRKPGPRGVFPSGTPERPPGVRLVGPVLTPQILRHQQTWHVMWLMWSPPIWALGCFMLDLNCLCGEAQSQARGGRGQSPQALDPVSTAVCEKNAAEAPDVRGGAGA